MPAADRTGLQANGRLCSPFANRELSGAAMPRDEVCGFSLLWPLAAGPAAPYRCWINTILNGAAGPAPDLPLPPAMRKRHHFVQVDKINRLINFLQ